MRDIYKYVQYKLIIQGKASLENMPFYIILVEDWAYKDQKSMMA